jgi:hypothetical protein
MAKQKKKKKKTQIVIRDEQGRITPDKSESKKLVRQIEDMLDDSPLAKKLHGVADLVSSGHEFKDKDLKLLEQIRLELSLLDQRGERWQRIFDEWLFKKMRDVSEDEDLKGR